MKIQKDTVRRLLEKTRVSQNVDHDLPVSDHQGGLQQTEAQPPTYQMQILVIRESTLGPRLL